MLKSAGRRLVPRGRAAGGRRCGQGDGIARLAGAASGRAGSSGERKMRGRPRVAALIGEGICSLCARCSALPSVEVAARRAVARGMTAGENLHAQPCTTQRAIS